MAERDFSGLRAEPRDRFWYVYVIFVVVGVCVVVYIVNPL